MLKLIIKILSQSNGFKVGIFNSNPLYDVDLLGSLKVLGDIVQSSSVQNIYTDTRFLSGNMGSGFRLTSNNSGSSLLIDDLIVRNTLRTHIFKKDVVNSQNGYVYFSDSALIVINASITQTGSQVEVYLKLNTLLVGDLVWYKGIDSLSTSGQIITGIKGTITSGSTETTLGLKQVYRYGITSNYGTGTLKVSGVLVRVGNINSTAGRMGSIYVDASSTNSPFIDIYDGVTSWDSSDTNSFSSGNKLKTRLGNLNGVTDPDFGILSGYGLYAINNIYIKGIINALAGGSIAGWSINSESLTKVDITNSNLIGLVSNIPTMYVSKNGTYAHIGKLWNGSYIESYGFGLADATNRYFQVGLATANITLPDSSIINNGSIYYWLGNTTNYMKWDNVSNRLLISGLIKASTGSIGGWLISSNSISKNNITLDSNGYIYIGSGTYKNSNTPFYVDKDGNFSLGSKLYYSGSSLTIDGNITSSAGLIGCWNISTESIYSGSNNYNNSNSIYFGISGLSIKDRFRVDSSGNLTATNANISGTISSSLGTIAGWSIDNTKIYKNKVSINSITSSYIQSLTIPAATTILSLTRGLTGSHKIVSDTLLYKTTTIISGSTTLQISIGLLVSVSFVYNIPIPTKQTYCDIFLTLYYTGLSTYLQNYKLIGGLSKKINVLIKNNHTGSRNIQYKIVGVQAPPKSSTDYDTVIVDLFSISKYDPQIQLSENGLFIFNNPSKYIKMGYISSSLGYYIGVSEFKGQLLLVDNLVVYKNLYNYGTTYVAGNSLLGTTSDRFTINTDGDNIDTYLYFNKNNNNAYIKYDGTNLLINKVLLGTSSYSNNSDKLDNKLSYLFLYDSGIYLIPTLTDNGNGTIIIGTGSYYTYSDNQFNRPIIYTQVTSSTNISLVDNTNNYIVFNNSNNPKIYSITDRSTIKQSGIIPLFTVYRSGNIIHYLQWDSLSKGLPNKISDRLVRTRRFLLLLGGLQLGQSGSRNVTITSGVAWYGAANITLLNYNSNTDQLLFYYHISGSWTSSIVSQFNNTQYDNGTSLQTVLPNQYVVNWIYRGIQSLKYSYVVLGNDTYNLSQAISSTPPTVPQIISAHSILVGRIIVQRDSNTAQLILNANNSQFVSSQVGVTNLLLTTSNGITNTIINSTTVPLITLGLGNITPTSLATSIIKPQSDSTSSLSIYKADGLTKLVDFNTTSSIITFSSSLRVTNQFTSLVSSGTSPFIINSTTKVDNLNVDLLLGMHASSSNVANTIIYRDSSGNFSANDITANLTGTASNSTMLNGLTYGKFARYDTSSKALVDSQILTPGFYNILELLLITGYGSYYYLIQLGSYSNGQYKAQITVPYFNGVNQGLLLRTAVGDVWNDWKKVWTETNDGIGSGLDADLFQGYRPYNFPLLDDGRLARYLIPDTNLNTITQSGYYRGINLYYAPLAAYNLWWFVEVIGHSSTWTRQNAYSFNYANVSKLYNIWTRQLQDGTWSLWAKIPSMLSLYSGSNWSEAWKNTATWKNILPYQSRRDFSSGSLIKTDIDYSVTTGEPWGLRITGNGYQEASTPFDLQVQGYIYDNTLICVRGISNGQFINGIKAFCYDTKLCFWFPRQGYWQGFNVWVGDSLLHSLYNRVISITDLSKPVSITKLVDISSAIYQSWHNGNDGIGSGLDADLWQGWSRASYLNQALLTSSNAIFSGISTNGIDKTFAETLFNNALGSTNTKVLALNGSTLSSMWWCGGNIPQLAIDSNTSGGGEIYVNSSSNWYAAIRINHDRRISIGDITPKAALHVFSITDNSFPTNSGTDQSGINTRFQNYNSNVVLDVGLNGGNGTWLQATNTTDLSQKYPLLLNPNGGNVGIGNTSPSAMLDVSSSNSTMNTLFKSPDGQLQIYLWNDGNNYILSTNGAGNASRNLRFAGYGGGNGTFNFIGNVGINNNIPSHSLDVAGNIRTNESLIYSSSNGVYYMKSTTTGFVIGRS